MMTLTNALKWTGLVLTLTGAILTSLNINPLNVYLLNDGALSYFLWSYRIRDVNLMLVNGGLLAIYFVGVAKNLLTLL